jgi:hypothetical protein
MTRLRVASILVAAAATLFVRSAWAAWCDIGADGRDSAQHADSCWLRDLGAAALYDDCAVFPLGDDSPPTLRMAAPYVVRLELAPTDDRPEPQLLRSRVPGYEEGLCESQILDDLPPDGFCTGFVLRAGLVVTAAHCLWRGEEALSLPDVRIVRDPLGCRGDPACLVPASVDSVAHASETAHPQRADDFVFLQVSRQAFPHGLADLPAPKDKMAAYRVSVLGYPLGTPSLRYSAPGPLVGQTADGMLRARVSAIGGNSGSIVLGVEPLDPAGPPRLVGLLRSGIEDFVRVDGGVEPCLCHSEAESGDAESIVPMQRILHAAEGL